MTKASPSSAAWSAWSVTTPRHRRSLAESLYKIALIADGEKRNAALDEAIGIVERLDAAGKWPADKKDLKENLFALRTPSQASQP